LPHLPKKIIAIAVCAFMKLNTLKLYLCMKYELPDVEIEEELRKKL
jgi:hypothetical protein